MPSPDMVRYPHLSIEESCEHQSARVCIATYEILGPSQNGGIGTAYFSLATTLASTGHDVTILHLSSEVSDRDAIEHWTIRFHTLGIRFVALPPTPRMINVPQCMLTARDAYAWLRKQEFDVIHFPELQGHGYTPSLRNIRDSTSATPPYASALTARFHGSGSRTARLRTAPTNWKWISWSANVWPWRT